MATKSAKELIEKYQTGRASAEEVAAIERWVMFGTMKEMDLSDEAVIADLALIRSNLPLVYKVKKVRLWPKIAVAAAAVAAVVFGIWLFSGKYQEGIKYQVSSIETNDIAPGRNGATITLAGGKVIALSGAKKGVIVGDEITYDDHTPVTDKSALGALEVTAETKKGQTYEFTLPDGTHVWLNADSKISFPNQFVGRERKILLNGEAYFEVAKDKAHPFIVESKDQQVEVLGTHFNLNTYGDAHPSTVTSLLEGSVKVTGKGGARILKPGERGVNTIKGVMLLKGSAEDDIDWKNGDFVFQEESLASIMRKVSRWYDVDVIYGADVDQNQTFGGKVSRTRNISQVIKALQATQALKFKIEGKKIYITN